MRAFVSSLAIAVALVTTTAHAAPPPKKGVELGARLLFGFGTYGGSVLAGVQIGGRVDPHVSLGAYADVAAHGAPLRFKCAGCADDHLPRSLRAGGFLDLHLAPRATVDPWFRFGLGVISNRATAAEVEGDFGLDIRFRRFAVGPLVALFVPLQSNYPLWVGLGVRVVVAP